MTNQYDTVGERLNQALSLIVALLPHQRVAHGDIEDFLMSINVIENLAGVDLFAGLGYSIAIAF